MCRFFVARPLGYPSLACPAIEPVESELLRGDQDLPCRRTQDTRERSLRELRQVVLLAQMRRHDVREPRPIERCQDLRRRIVAQVPMVAADACFERLRITARRKHPRIVIAFEHERIATAEHGRNMRCRRTDVRQDS